MRSARLRRRATFSTLSPRASSTTISIRPAARAIRVRPIALSVAASRTNNPVLLVLLLFLAYMLSFLDRQLIALMVDQKVSVWDLEDIGDWWTRADASKIAPIVAVPTTAGTGSEVGRAGVLERGHGHSRRGQRTELQSAPRR